jgi:predicted translin family RNA/ssDNA-binding protein
MNRASLSSVTHIHQFAAVEAASREIERAQNEIERLRLELAQAREELENLTEATSDFVRLML